jgi:hypothetical protein
MRIIPTILLLVLLVVSSIGLAHCWSNGGFSTDDPSNPKYGTHDWIAQHALDWLPTQEKLYITDNLAAYLYGTELPDNNNASAPGHIGDTSKHHIYFYSNGTLQDDSAAAMASTEYQTALNLLNTGNYSGAAETAGIMSHYIADVAVWSHVMGATTDWGAESENVHSNYESYVNTRTSSYVDSYNSYLVYDGSLITLSAYNAALNLANDSTFDHDGIYTCVWMNNSYSISNPTYWNRAGESLNLAVNAVSDVLHTLYINSNVQPTPTPSSTPTAIGTDHIVINEVEQNPPGTDAGNEYVELYNPTVNSVDISGWIVSTTAGDNVALAISSGTIIQHNGYYLMISSSQWIDNSGESVILRNFGGNEVDRTPSLADADNDGWSWQRYPNGQDTDSSADWAFRSSTKGAPNGETSTPTPTPTPTPSPTPSPSPPNFGPTSSPTVSPTIVPTTIAPITTASPILHPTATPTQVPTASPYSSHRPTTSPTVPELPTLIILPLFAAATFLSIALIRKMPDSSKKHNSTTIVKKRR